MTSFSSTVWHIQKYNVESQLSVILSWSYAHTHALALCIFPQRSIYHKRKCVWIFNVAQGHRKTNVYDLPHARMRILLTEKCRCAEAYALQLHFGDTFFFVVSISFLSSSSLDFFTYFDFIIVVIVDGCVCVFFLFLCGFFVFTVWFNGTSFLFARMNFGVSALWLAHVLHNKFIMIVTIVAYIFVSNLIKPFEWFTFELFWFCDEFCERCVTFTLSLVFTDVIKWIVRVIVILQEIQWFYSLCWNDAVIKVVRMYDSMSYNYL